MRFRLCRSADALSSLTLLSAAAFTIAFNEVVSTGLAVAQAPSPQGAPAQPPGTLGAPSFTETLLSMLPMFAMVYLIFYFLVSRPAQQKQLAQARLMEELKKGDLVTTKAGMIGRVAAREKDHILLEVAPNTKIKFEPGAVTGKWESKPERANASDKGGAADKAGAA